MHTVSWIIALAGVTLGTLLLIMSLALAGDSPEATERAAQALCCVAIPYVLARAVDKLAE